MRADFVRHKPQPPAQDHWAGNFYISEPRPRAHQVDPRPALHREYTYLGKLVKCNPPRTHNPKRGMWYRTCRARYYASRSTHRAERTARQPLQVG